MITDFKLKKIFHIRSPYKMYRLNVLFLLFSILYAGPILKPILIPHVLMENSGEALNCQWAYLASTAAALTFPPAIAL